MSAVLNGEDVFPLVMPWGQMLDDLANAGYSTNRVATLLGVDWSTVENWRKGEPRHSFGQALIDLHHLVCGEEFGKLRYMEARPRG